MGRQSKPLKELRVATFNARAEIRHRLVLIPSDKDQVSASRRVLREMIDAADRAIDDFRSAVRRR